MWRLLALAFLFPALVAAQEEHNHPAPEKLGTVSFPTSCEPTTQQEFNRAIALLHSFAYKPAEEVFQSVAERDPRCAIAHWGVAMTHYHQLWEPRLPRSGIVAAQKEIALAATLPEASERERGFIRALSLVFKDTSILPYTMRASNYEKAMREFAATNPKDVEAQVFYALAILSNASPLIPAREQLGDLLLEQGEFPSASKAFETALVNAPGRRGALLGALQAARSR